MFYLPVKQVSFIFCLQSSLAEVIVQAFSGWVGNKFDNYLDLIVLVMGLRPAHHNIWNSLTASPSLTFVVEKDVKL